MFVSDKHHQGAVRMKRIILAISGIFWLQLAFIGYNMGDPTAEQSFVRVDAEASEVLTASAIDSPFADQTDPIDLDTVYPDDETAEDLTSAFARPTRAVAAQPRREIARRLRRPARNTFVESTQAIRPVTIAYNTYQPVAFRVQPEPRRIRTEYPQRVDITTERSEVRASAKMPSSKKKGFFAKSFNVIKKPYDWLKAVGSAIR
jgi:hypothetical protein